MRAGAFKSPSFLGSVERYEWQFKGAGLYAQVCWIGRLMHRIGGVTLVQPQLEAGMLLGRCLGASTAGCEDGLGVG